MRPRAVALAVRLLLAVAAATPLRDPPPSLRARFGRFHTGVMPVDCAVDFILGRDPACGSPPAPPRAGLA
jgi:hypothetical protein